MIRHGQETMIFLDNNRGYVSESIHDGPDNYFKNWDYAGLIAAWNASDDHGLGVTPATGATAR
jgi:TPP-dependent 2-oxoacid decarboxylase